jgi:hypothetical protein
VGWTWAEAAGPAASSPHSMGKVSSSFCIAKAGKK